MHKFNYSFVVTTYNRPSLLERCLSSIACINHNNFDVVVIDDCSTTKYPINDLKAKFPWIEYLKLPKNSGPGIARNTGIKIAKNNWIIIIDDDDEVLSDCLIAIDDIFSNFPNINTFPVIQFALTNGHLNKEYELINIHHYLDGSITGDFVPIINREFFLSKEIHYPNLRVGGESLLWWKLAERYGIPTYSKIVCKVNTDAPERLTNIDHQIKRANEYGNLQKIILNQFSNIYLYYPKAKLKRMIGYIVYKKLANNTLEARTFLRNHNKEFTSHIFLILYLFTHLPKIAAKFIFIFFRLTAKLKLKYPKRLL